jgi:hypothetical protein
MISSLVDRDIPEVITALCRIQKMAVARFHIALVAVTFL